MIKKFAELHGLFVITVLICFVLSAGKALAFPYGKVKVVNAFPDYKVKVVKSFADYKVKVVDSFPDNPGYWQFVDSFPDFTIQFVDSFPDFTVEFE